MNKEEWKNIEGYEGLYQVSNFGNVKSLITNKILKISYIEDKRNYSHITLHKNKKLKTFNIHRLVAKAFIPNPNSLPCINHKDENKSNNCVDNLEWCEYLYNNIYGTRIQRVFKNRKKKVLQKDLNNNIINSFESSREASRCTGYAQRHISDCCLNKIKTYKGYKWEYAKF